MLQQLVCSFITFKRVLNLSVCHWQRTNVVHSLHVLLLLHGLLEDQVVDHEHDDHGEPEGEGGGDEGVRDIGDKSANMIPRDLPILEQTGTRWSLISISLGCFGCFQLFSFSQKQKKKQQISIFFSDSEHNSI